MKTPKEGRNNSINTKKKTIKSKTKNLVERY